MIFFVGTCYWPCTGVILTYQNGLRITKTMVLSLKNCYVQFSKEWFHMIPSGKLTWLWKITIFNGKFHYKWPFSIAMLVFQRVDDKKLRCLRESFDEFLMVPRLRMKKNSNVWPSMRKSVARFQTLWNISDKLSGFWNPWGCFCPND